MTFHADFSTSCCQAAFRNLDGVLETEFPTLNSQVTNLEEQVKYKPSCGKQELSLDITRKLLKPQVFLFCINNLSPL